jgi:hypothetical protein
MSRRWKWNRKRYERARRLSRQLGSMRDLPDQPRVVQRYLDLMRPHEEQQDPLDSTQYGYRCLRRRLKARRDDDDDLPF